MRRPAFTLLELLLVLGIIVMISGMGIVGFQRQRARSEFKNGVVELQVDLSLARLLAMHTGNAYVFRYAPGSGVYEIAPLKTLQETIYRMNGDLRDENEADALGGSLVDEALNSTASFASSGLFSSSSVASSGTPVYTDDLFSPENIAADMAYAAQAGSREPRFGATNVDLTGGLGGSLASSPVAASGFESGGDGLTFSSTISGYSSPYGYSSDYSGTGGEFSLEFASGSEPSQSPLATLRELDGTEKLLADERTIASRVNLDGVVIRKRASGNVIFTFMRLSDSTPTKLKKSRAKGVKNSVADPVSGISEGEDLGSVLGGSLLSIPSGITGEGLGGGLRSAPGYEDDPLAEATIQEEQEFVSLWSEPLLFFPNGKTSSAVIGFASIGEYSFYSEIALRGMTGVARISGISAIPPEMDPNQTALTQDQLTRLQNPGATYSDDQKTDTIRGGSLADPTIDLAAPTSFQGDVYGSFNDNFDSDASAIVPSINYGSSERRSGYRFDERAPEGGQPSDAGISAVGDTGAGAFGAASALSPGFPASTGSASEFGASNGASNVGANASSASTSERDDQDQNDRSKTGGSL